ncbi:MAG: GTPase ObgE [Candidatus Colwellbacteria bacterium]|nr:GTPase ObgE [Candidatus Colwellbacteria bacterium]
MLVDEVKIKISSGKGGSGAVAFNKNMMSLGPTGGSGGRGASIYMEGVSDLSALNKFRYKKEIRAEDGGRGREQFVDGADGGDLVVNVPVGTVIKNLTTEREVEITKIGERILIAKGGNGGKGNFLFRSSRNTTPKQSQPGKPGESFELHLELKLIADVGFVGLPNVGKSSMLNELTAAKSKVANYPFTTLEPNLGVYHEIILADIPGLIEGAAVGKGLGVKFLRHIERTKILFHFISAESVNPAGDYKVIREELGRYNESLLEKKEYVFLSKSDAVSSAVLRKQLSALRKIKVSGIPTSIHDWDSLEKVKKILSGIIKQKTV